MKMSRLACCSLAFVSWACFACSGGTSDGGASGGAAGAGGSSGSGGSAGAGGGSGGSAGAGGGAGGTSGSAGAIATGGASGAGGGAGAGGTAGVGGGAGSGGALSTATSGDFLLIDYNVAGLPEALSGSEPEINTPFIAPLLNDYDLCLLQETWQTPNPNPLMSAGLRVYHEILVAASEHPYLSDPAPLPLGSDPTRTTALVSDGLNRFSEFPFGPVDRQRWTDCFGDQNTGAGDCLATKGFSMATHSFAVGVEVDVYNLHAEAGSTTTDQALQVADFQQLGDYVVANSSGNAVLLAGDMNLHTERSEDRVIWDDFLAQTGLTDVCATVDCGGEDDRIEKLAYRSNAAVMIEPTSHEFQRQKFTRPTDGAPLSDHPPLVVGIHWEKVQ